MTGGYYTIVNYPYEGGSVTEHKTKREAVAVHKENVRQVEQNGYLLGAALVHIDVVDEKGDWNE